ncbi:MAG: M23 family metallopeptidase [Hydrotalea sp.]|nr:M23 family metallopeptidase [Hydrotalea sp.]
MKNVTAFDDLGKRANKFSRPVAVFFILMGIGALFLGYWFQDNLQLASDGSNPAIKTADTSSIDNALDATGLGPQGDNSNAPSALPGTGNIVGNVTLPSATKDKKANNSAPTPTTAIPLVAANISKNDLYSFMQKDSFGKALVRGGVSPAEAYLATQQARKIFPLSSLGENQVVKLDFGRTADNQRFLKQFSVRVGDTSQLLVKRLDGGTFEATMNQLAVDNSVKLYRFKIDKTGSLASSAEAAGLSQENIQNMVDLLSLDINLQTDIHTADLIQLLFDESTVAQKDEIGGNLRVVFVSSPKVGTDNAFFYFVDEGGSAGYYNSDGKSQRKMLLATPVDGARITSGFGDRLHPVLGFTRAHRGIDFAAPIGTKVKASGDGVVEVLRWESGYGNYLKIRHRDGYATAYAHLSRYDTGLALGSKVKQGQIVAYVGNTGISTGPHLHYEIMISDNQVNPSTVKLPALRALRGNDLNRFELVKKDALLRIQNAQIMAKE